jgi:hypothetical protein
MPRRIDHLPPTLGEGPGSSPRRVRIVINVEIHKRRRRQGPRVVGVIGALVWLLLVLGLAHGAEPPRYEHWQDTRSGWQGQTRTEGTTVDRDAYGPHGK